MQTQRFKIFLFVLLLSCSAAVAQDDSRREGDDYLFPIASEGACEWEKVQPGKAVAEALSGASRKKGVLFLPAAFPGTLQLRRSLSVEERGALGNAKFFCVRIRVPSGLDHDTPITIRLVAQHPQWGDFVSQPTVQLEPGRWNEICWPLSAEAGGWVSLTSPGLEWNDVLRRRLQSIGLELFCQSGEEIELALTDVVAQSTFVFRPPFGVKDLNYPDEQPVPVGRIFEMQFDLTRAYDNPFDPEEIAVDVEYKTPSGRRMRLPAFYYQDYQRVQMANGTERNIPRGKAHWRARFTPLEPGVHRFTITGKDGDGYLMRSDTFEFRAEKSDFKGMVGVDPNDSTYLSFADGSFFYPTGLIVRSPYDTRTKYHYEFEPKPDRGLIVYDNIFPKMREAGLNYTRVWMSSWWAALEWSEGIRPDYAGLGRYSMLSAWRLDYVMNLARQNNLHVALTLQNHGQFSLNVDPEWVDNPYNVLNGGFVHQPDEFWSDPRSREMYKKRLRYIIGRWASDPAIVWYEMSNELDLVHNYRNRKPQIYDWHREMAGYIHEHDPYKHLVSTHFVGGRFDGAIFELEELDVVQSNGYSQNMVTEVPKLFNDYRDAASNKPCFINEYGEGTRIDTHLSNFHSGLWTSGVYPLCGPAMFWYFQYIQGGDHWNQYRAFVKFSEGEDYRGRNYSPAQFRAHPGEIQSVGMGNNHSMRFWVSDKRFYPQNLREDQVPDVLPEALVKKASVEMFGLVAGRYEIEYWDTWGEGGIREGATQTIDYDGKGALRVSVPSFRRDIACKVEKIK